MASVRTTVSLPESLFAEIKKEAKKRGMSVSKFVALSLEELIMNQKKKKAAMQILEMVERKPLSKEEVELATTELKKLENEWKE